MAADQYQKIQGAPSVCDTSATFELRKMGVPERGLPVWCLLYMCGSIDTEGILCSTWCSLQVECHGGFLISAPMEASPSLGMRGCTVVTVFLERLWDVNHKISAFTQSHCTCWLPEHANILTVIYSDYFNHPDCNQTESSAHHYFAIVRTSEQAGNKIWASMRGARSKDIFSSLCVFSLSLL